jgi:hypothetical protein
MDGFLQDLRFAARALRRSPLFTLSTIATLGLGLGILTGFFAIVEAVLLTPIPIHGNTVVRIWKLDPQRSVARFPLSYPELRLWRERASENHRPSSGSPPKATSKTAAETGAMAVAMVSSSISTAAVAAICGCRSTGITRPTPGPSLSTFGAADSTTFTSSVGCGLASRSNGRGPSSTS